MYTYKYPHPAMTVDVVIFTIRDNRLKLLLIQRAGEPYEGKWALPGGFVRPDEGLDEAAQRELEEETGVGGVYLEQLYTFGEPDRDPRERVITVAYYALVPSGRLRLRAATDAEAVGWFGLDERPALAFDHDEIVAMAHRRLVAKLDYSTIAFQFMPEAFTLSELQRVYEIILQSEVDKRNFRKWVLALEQIEETGEERREGAHRPAKLYRVKAPGRVQFIK
ncbi:MAG: NUDIX hydrolase [Gammaproteobacteria bacterium]|nr:NUDIX hydrolase [Gammaproteobacteria bacterium]NIR98632.1 NUDIX hydrolase [Gammaproteobacteria bacterium]NIT64355.1 NUDIX hydrolase [Gammaproteobacteria bacterium]NIV21279.1 NUDIX domain-containing protein [Gammaproteobacteria bacterium]NIX10983.1 NUDIX domain-containing protein [Gammaproteobacteria bacterium]